MSEAEQIDQAMKAASNPGDSSEHNAPTITPSPEEVVDQAAKLRGDIEHRERSLEEIDREQENPQRYTAAKKQFTEELPGLIQKQQQHDEEARTYAEENLPELKEQAKAVMDKDFELRQRASEVFDKIIPSALVEAGVRKDALERVTSAKLNTSSGINGNTGFPESVTFIRSFRNGKLAETRLAIESSRTELRIGADGRVQLDGYGLHPVEARQQKIAEALSDAENIAKASVAEGVVQVKFRESQPSG